MLDKRKRGLYNTTCTPHGEVTKWLKVSDLKSDRSRKRREGSNPSFSAFPLSGTAAQLNIFILTLEKYPSWPKGHPWKGCRSLIAARGFKSLLLRSRKPVELSTGFDLLWVFVRESRALKAVLRTAASSCLRTANPGSIARRVRSIPPSPRKKRAREALFFRGESSWSLSPSAGGASETARRSSRQAKRCGCRNNPASGKAASRKGSARLRAIPPSPRRGDEEFVDISTDSALQQQRKNAFT